MLDGKITISTDDNAIELLALFTEVLGMYSENLERQAAGQGMAYYENAFCNMANQMRNLKSELEEN